MKISKFFYLIASFCVFVFIAGCDDEDGPLRPGEVISQPQDIDLDLEFPKDRALPLKNDIRNSVNESQLPKDNLIINEVINNKDLFIDSSDIEEVVENYRTASKKELDNDVFVYNYGEMTLLGLHELIIPDITKETIDESILFAFYNPANEKETAWHQMPGIGSTGLYNISTSLYQRNSDCLFVIKTTFPSGVSYKESVALRGVKIYIFT